MDFTVLFVVLLLGVSIPLRNKAIKEYRKKGQGQQSSKTNGGKNE